MDIFAERFERKSKLKEEELRIRKLELELNQKKWEIEEQVSCESSVEYYFLVFYLLNGPAGYRTL